MIIISNEYKMKKRQANKILHLPFDKIWDYKNTKLYNLPRMMKALHTAHKFDASINVGDYNNALKSLYKC